ncbi:LCP family protein [Streptomyces sp. SL13]|uniref:LCP family protein n=1 Tax=Streptantibioticus silvisoli TaxID=2705255 RepID=A0AA90KAZ4_9ACTN|nr:LCP family protein [Streptantibioticus silvisoli]MDI5965214.1 LCP family protein [Streptantibioticus silvisoli]MDI5973003.1 LCP family protein [Streptantibioticus silvisoli]
MFDTPARRGGIPGIPGDARQAVPDAPGQPIPGTPTADVPAGPAAVPARRRRRGRRVLKWVSLGVAVLLLATAGAGYAYYRHLNHNIRKGERSSGHTFVRPAKPNAAGQTPLNILLIGSDSRDSADDVALGGARENAGGPARADVEMLLHVSADRRHAALVSIPRDTRVDIPRCVDPKSGQVYPPVETIINASLSRGGPGCTLATWENLTGVYIDHWMEVDFAGVVKMADAVGGVDVCVKENIWDHPTLAIPHGGSGLKLTAGTHRITGKQALQWLRTRDAFGSDLGRAQAQHMYLASMLRELRAQDVFTDPTRLMGLADTATRSIVVSSEIGTVDKLYGLAQQLKDVSPDAITMATMPTVPDPQDPQAHLVPDTRPAGKLWSMLRNDVPFDGSKTVVPGTSATATPSGPPAHPDASIAVTVVNGTGGAQERAVAGRGSAITAALTARGFARAVTSQALAASAGTTVTFPAATGAQGLADATAVAGALHIPASAVKASGTATAVTVTVGADWTTGTDYAATVPPAGQVPAGSDSLNGSDTHACMDVYGPYQW